MTLENILRGYAKQMDGFLRADRLYRKLMAHACDGTEVFCVIDDALRGLENERAATKIKLALLDQYRNTIRVSDAVEIVLKLLEEGALS